VVRRVNVRCCRYSGNSYSLIGGWGPFEVIDMAVAMGAEPIITTTSSSTPESFADLVEYCWGDEKTPMGKQRVEDGHPEQYKLQYIELGNGASDLTRLSEPASCV
jgi:alpha-L-arabinofuranosidase